MPPPPREYARLTRITAPRRSTLAKLLLVGCGAGLMGARCESDVSCLGVEVKGTVAWRECVGAHQTWSWEEDDLGTIVTREELESGDVVGVYSSSSANTEVLYFLENPETWADALVKSRAWTPLQIDRSPAAGFRYPYAGFRDEVERHVLDTYAFYEPLDHRELQTVRLYDKGTCSAASELQGDFSQATFDAVINAVGAQFTDFNAAYVEQRIDAIHITSLLRHPADAAASVDVGGGYAINLQATVKPTLNALVPLPIPVPNPVLTFARAKVQGTASYEFELVGGILEGRIVSNDVVVTNAESCGWDTYTTGCAARICIFGTSWCPCVLPTATAVVCPDTSKIRHEVKALFTMSGQMSGAERQKFAVPTVVEDFIAAGVTAEFPVDCQAEDPCEHARDLMRLAAKRGANAVGVDDDDKTLRDAIEARANSNYNYVCRETPGQPDQCDFIVRAKRLNVYPDEVELVWFDGPPSAPEGSWSTGYVAFLAVHAQPALQWEFLPTLCTGAVCTKLDSDGNPLPADTLDMNLWDSNECLPRESPYLTTVDRHFFAQSSNSTH